MEDVEMKDETNQKKPQEKPNEIYEEFLLSLGAIIKSINMKDLKALSTIFQKINKFRKNFKDEDFAYLNELYLKNHYLFQSFKYDLSLPKNFVIQPNVYDKTKDLPEICGFIFIIILTKTIDNKNYEEAYRGIEYLIDYFSKNQNLTIQALKAKAYYYLSLVSERLGKMDTIISQLHAAYRNACVQMDEITQVTLINCIIRFYLKNEAVEKARNFISKIKYQENISTNEDARYLFYLGRIEAIQMNYSEAFKHLTNSFRKAPEKCGEGFKNVVNKLLIIVQLLMGEIPPIHSILTQNKLKDFRAFQPYLDLVKVVKHGNLEEYKKLLTSYESQFEKDGNFTLTQRIRHVVIKAGLRKINLSYSRISIKDITEKLKLDNEKETEYIIAKAISDGVFLAKVNHDEGYVQSLEMKDIYSTFEPQKSYQTRIDFLNKINNECHKAMKYSDKMDHHVRNKYGELEEDDTFEEGLLSKDV